MSNYEQVHSETHQRLIKIQPIEIKQQTKNSPKDYLTIDVEKKKLSDELEQIRMEIKALKKEKEQILQSAMIEIKQKQEAWENEKVQLINAAQEQGYKEGFKKGENDGVTSYTQKIDHINELVNLTTDDYHKVLEQSDGIVVDISLHIAKKIIGEKLVENPKRYTSLVIKAIEEIKNQSVISIYTHPDNYELLVKQKGELMHAVDGDTKISIYVDQRMSEHDCLIKHPLGQIDASVDTQLEKIREALYQLGTEKDS